MKNLLRIGLGLMLVVLFGWGQAQGFPPRYNAFLTHPGSPLTFAPNINGNAMAILSISPGTRLEVKYNPGAMNGYSFLIFYFPIINGNLDSEAIVLDQNGDFFQYNDDQPGYFDPGSTCNLDIFNDYYRWQPGLPFLDSRLASSVYFHPQLYFDYNATGSIPTSSSFYIQTGELEGGLDVSKKGVVVIVRKKTVDFACLKCVQNKSSRLVEQPVSGNQNYAEHQPIFPWIIAQTQIKAIELDDLLRGLLGGGGGSVCSESPQDLAHRLPMNKRRSNQGAGHLKSMLVIPFQPIATGKYWFDYQVSKNSPPVDFFVFEDRTLSTYGEFFPYTINSQNLVAQQALLRASEASSGSTNLYSQASVTTMCSNHGGGEIAPLRNNSAQDTCCPNAYFMDKRRVYYLVIGGDECDSFCLDKLNIHYCESPEKFRANAVDAALWDEVMKNPGVNSDLDAVTRSLQRNGFFQPGIDCPLSKPESGQFYLKYTSGEKSPDSTWFSFSSQTNGQTQVTVPHSRPIGCSVFSYQNVYDPESYTSIEPDSVVKSRGYTQFWFDTRLGQEYKLKLGYSGEQPEPKIEAINRFAPKARGPAAEVPKNRKSSTRR